MNDRETKKPRYRCKLCGDSVAASDLRDHLASHSTAAESAIEDPTEFFEEILAKMEMADDQKEIVYDLKDFVHDHLEDLVDHLDEAYAALGCITAAEIRLQDLKRHVWDCLG